MTPVDFKQTLGESGPPTNMDAPVRALWWDARGDWQRAHAEVDSLETDRGMAVHAYLHRKEGDQSNASYWYRRAGRPWPASSLPEEWTRLVDELLLPESNSPASPAPG